MSAGKPMVLRNISTQEQVRVYSIAGLQSLPGFSNISSLIRFTNERNSEGVNAVICVSQCRTFMLNSFDLLKEIDALYDKKEYEVADKKLADLRNQVIEKKARLDEISNLESIKSEAQVTEDLTYVKRFMVDIINTGKARNTLDIKAMICIFDNSATLDSVDSELDKIDRLAALGPVPNAEAIFVDLEKKVKLLSVKFAELRRVCDESTQEKLTESHQKTVDNIDVALKTLHVCIKMREGFYFTTCATIYADPTIFIDRALNSFEMCLDLKSKHPLPETVVHISNHINILSQIVSFNSQKRVAYKSLLEKSPLSAPQLKDFNKATKTIERRSAEMLGFPTSFRSTFETLMALSNIFLATGDLDTAIEAYENINKTYFLSKENQTLESKIANKDVTQKIIFCLQEKMASIVAQNNTKKSQLDKNTKLYEDANKKIHELLDELINIKIDFEEDVRAKVFACETFVKVGDVGRGEKISNGLLSELTTGQFKSDAMKYLFASIVNAHVVNINLLLINGKAKKPTPEDIERIGGLNKIALANLYNAFNISGIDGPVQDVYANDALTLCIKNLKNLGQLHVDIANKQDLPEEKKKYLLTAKELYTELGAIYCDDNKKFPSKNFKLASAVRQFFNGAFRADGILRFVSSLEIDLELVNDELKELSGEKRKQKKQIVQDVEAEKKLAVKHATKLAESDKQKAVEDRKSDEEPKQELSQLDLAKIEMQVRAKKRSDEKAYYRERYKGAMGEKKLLDSIVAISCLIELYSKDVKSLLKQSDSAISKVNNTVDENTVDIYWNELLPDIHKALALADDLLVSAKEGRQVAGLTMEQIKDYTIHITIDSENAEENTKKLQKKLNSRVSKDEEAVAEIKERKGEDWWKNNPNPPSKKAQERQGYKALSMVVPTIVKSAEVLNSGAKYANSKANAEDVKSYDSTEIEKALEGNPLAPQEKPSVVTFASYVDQATVSSAGWSAVAKVSKGNGKRK